MPTPEPGNHFDDVTSQSRAAGSPLDPGLTPAHPDPWNLMVGSGGWIPKEKQMLLPEEGALDAKQAKIKNIP